MLFVVKFVDKKPSVSSSLRKKFLQSHLDWLDANRNLVRVAGSLRRTPDANPVGGLWIVDADSKAAVERLIATDPFWMNGLRDHVEILYWSKAFDDEVAI